MFFAGRLFAIAVTLAVVLLLHLAAGKALAASLQSPLGGQATDLIVADPSLIPEAYGTKKTAPRPGAHGFLEPETRNSVAETCTFSLDALCSDETDWINRGVFGTEYRFDPADDAQGAPSDSDLGFDAMIGGGAADINGTLSGQGPSLGTIAVD